MKKFEFHVSISTRQKYQFDHSLFSINGDLIVADFQNARLLSQKINETRRAFNEETNFTTPGQINSLALIHEIFHFIIRHYEVNENPGVFERSINYFTQELGEKELNILLKEYVKNFPPLAVYKGEITVDEYLTGYTEEKFNKEIIIEELILLHLENINPAFNSLKELFDETPLAKSTAYNNFLIHSEIFFEQEKPFSLEGSSLLKSLRVPILANPLNIEEQLNYLRFKWGVILDEKFLQRILGGTDLIKEDVKLFLAHGGFGTPPVPSYKFALSKEEIENIKLALAAGKKLSDIDEINLSYLEYEKFTEDIEWMPNVVMIAKNIFVWMDQLSKKYEREITSLDNIPDEELDLLVSWNITALWLIGLWERSSASKKIKQFCGNPDAASSAYSLYDYEVAFKLGGDEAFQKLKYRCWQRGIRLSSDMVPNHTGIYSKWILEHPEFFIQSENPPFPNYSYTGPNLSDHPQYQIRIEDKYYTKSDAAVVFQMIENNSGITRYIYHGNDGTNMPWNDTAQLNLLKQEVREAIIQTIMHVAKKTPIIRFDAAMTLAKKHFSRLWFPQPGLGGAIPSRADYAMTRDQFDSIMPNEFWREVVDRINSEMPNTLLLAEAFWLMEGFFVRTLGMHRVYNSAFMHMFMKEENQKYRELIKNTIEFNPEILKRYVNFMSNPDEETAVNQFGKGDKYFGIAVMMVTLPGLPMLAHGQVEGFTEKYGMEYQRAYYNETVDNNLVKRHEAEIFPLLKKRHVFSQVENFELYDFIESNGEVNQNVFAFTNRAKDEKVLVIYNNSYAATHGYIKYSSGKILAGFENCDKKEFNSQQITDALQIKNDEKYFYVLKDHRTKLEYLKNGKELCEQGFLTQLNGYQYQVFFGFEEFYDFNGEIKKLYLQINNNGVNSIHFALKEMKLSPLHNSLTELFNKSVIDELKSFCGLRLPASEELSLSYYVKMKLIPVINEIKNVKGLNFNASDVLLALENDLIHFRELNSYFVEHKDFLQNTLDDEIKKFLVYDSTNNENPNNELILIYIVIKRLLAEIYKIEQQETSVQLYESLLLERPIWQSLLHLGNNYKVLKQEFDLMKLLASAKSLFLKSKVELDKSVTENSLLEMFESELVKDFIGFNSYGGIKYFNKENFELLLNWNFTIEFIRSWEDAINLKIEDGEFLEEVNQLEKIINTFIDSAKKADYRFDDFIKAQSIYTVEAATTLLSVSNADELEIKTMPEDLNKKPLEDKMKKEKKKKNKEKDFNSEEEAVIKGEKKTKGEKKEEKKLKKEKKKEEKKKLKKEKKLEEKKIKKNKKLEKAEKKKKEESENKTKE
ncbi:MAG: alpha-amylase [Chlorobiaceae bacterium]|nr:alpha-amylase [Chlorobiaceae bacterium]